MNKFAIVLGYPYPDTLERPTVEFASKHGLVNVLGSFMAFNFSVHSKIGKAEALKQNHIKDVNLDPSKIYITFGLSDLALNSIQSFYYEIWEDKNRGKIKLNWWMNPIVLEFCPGIAQYYYETKTENDYFYTGHVKERIRPSDFPYLEEYLERSNELLEKCDLKAIGFGNHKKWDEDVFNKYSRTLNVSGFYYGFGPKAGDISKENYWFYNNKIFIANQIGPVSKYEDTYSEIKKYIDAHPERPLFIPVVVLIAKWTTINDLIRVKEDLKKEYPGKIEFVRGDELILMIKQFNNFENQ
jgi:hypothetical protein